MAFYDDEFSPPPVPLRSEPRQAAAAQPPPQATRGYARIGDQWTVPSWESDELVRTCRGCGVEFGVFVRKHHCRLCGLIFCDNCTQQRLLLPENFCATEPQRTCDGCAPSLGPLQPELLEKLANSTRDNPLKDGDVTGSLRRYTNSPLKFDLGAEIRKAAWTLKNQIDGLEASLGDDDLKEALLEDAEGLAILTIFQGGCIGTVSFGTGLVIRRLREGDASFHALARGYRGPIWSAPCAVGTLGVGFGATFGAELTDMVVVIREEAGMRAFMSGGQVALGAELALALGPFGRNAKADVRASTRAVAPTVSYSHSRGFYGGISLDGSFLKVRDDVNRDFYGRSVEPSELLMGVIPPPQGGEALYQALEDVFAPLCPPGSNAGYSSIQGGGGPEDFPEVDDRGPMPPHAYNEFAEARVPPVSTSGPYAPTPSPAWGVTPPSRATVPRELEPWQPQGFQEAPLPPEQAAQAHRPPPPISEDNPFASASLLAASSSSSYSGSVAGGGQAAAGTAAAVPSHVMPPTKYLDSQEVAV